MPFCPKCGKDIREPVNYCPNCSFPVADLFQKVEGSQQPAGTQAPAPVVKGVRTSPITAAAIISLLLGGTALIMSFIVFGLMAVIAGQPASAGTVVGLVSGLTVGGILLASAIIHLIGWHWLWQARVRGGVVGIIAAIFDIAAVVIGFMVMALLALPTLGLVFLTSPFILPILFLDSMLGIIMLIMIAIGWKTLK